MVLGDGPLPDGAVCLPSDTTATVNVTCPCPQGTTSCAGSTGTYCASAQTDPNNCGGCGVTCGGTCSAGRCLVTLASWQFGSQQIAVDTQSVYLTKLGASANDYTEGTVMKVSLAGNSGAPTTLAAAQCEPNAIAIDSANVYWGTNGGCATDLDPEVIRGYDAPFPDQLYVEGARQFPALVPISTDDPAVASNQAAWKVLESLDMPFLTAFSDGDPITAGLDRIFQQRIPGARGRPHVTIVGGGHFLQEDKGPELARVVVDFAQSA